MPKINLSQKLPYFLDKLKPKERLAKKRMRLPVPKSTNVEGSLSRIIFRTTRDPLSLIRNSEKPRFNVSASER